ncbi:MAG TPA: MarR family transcriptional regulator [Solirubrobacteraceae bacterium]|jgi:DNA-binding MarR family transcriptional regulator|nr:MarR family transcriptional regulator [Solirubrobacteraceae bacterium]
MREQEAGGDGAGCVPAASVLEPWGQAVGFMLSSIGYAVSRRFHQMLAPLELEPREFALLRAVGAAEGRSQQALAEHLQIPPSRMVAFVDALERRGLLERRHNPLDRRARALHLTDAGRELLGRALELAFALERDLCAELSAEERGQTMVLLARVGARLGLPAGGSHAHAALADEQPPAVGRPERPEPAAGAPPGEQPTPAPAAVAER